MAVPAEVPQAARVALGVGSHRLGLLREIVRRPAGTFGLLVVALLVLAALIPGVLAPYGPDEQDIPARLQGPSIDHLLGTDELGRDLLSRVIFSCRIELGVAIPAVLGALIAGLVLGVLAGYVGGWLDNALIVVMDSLQAFPAVILALVLLSLLGSSLLNVIIVIAVAFTPNYARVENGGISSRSTTIAFTFFDPITAPTPPGGETGRAAVLVAERDTRDQALVLTHRAAERDRDLLAVLAVQHVLGLEVALAEIRPGVVELDRAVLLEVNDHPVGRGVEQREAGDLLLAEPVAEAAAPLASLTPPVSGLLQPTLVRLAFDLQYRERPGREDRGWPASRSSVAAPSSSRVLAMKYRPALTMASPSISRFVMFRSLRRIS